MIKIRKIIRHGNLDYKPNSRIDTNAILDQTSDLLIEANSHEILGEIMFIGEDDRVYCIVTEAVVKPVDPEYLAGEVTHMLEEGEADSFDNETLTFLKKLLI